MVITWYPSPNEIGRQLQSLQLDVDCVLPVP